MRHWRKLVAVGPLAIVAIILGPAIGSPALSELGMFLALLASLTVPAGIFFNGRDEHKALWVIAGVPFGFLVGTLYLAVKGW